jgi:hypothetical protein
VEQGTGGPILFLHGNLTCWVVYFRDNVIVRVRAYLDSAMVAGLFEENSTT